MGEILQKRLRQSKPLPLNEDAFLSLLVAASHLHQEMDLLLEPFGITQSQYNILRILRGVYPEGHSRNDILVRLIDRSPDVTRMIDKLVKMELVERDSSSNDRRLSIAKITEKGLALVNAIIPHTHVMQQQFASRFTEQEFMQISEYCERIFGSTE